MFDKWCRLEQEMGQPKQKLPSNRILDKKSYRKFKLRKSRDTYSA